MRKWTDLPSFFACSTAPDMGLDCLEDPGRQTLQDVPLVVDCGLSHPELSSHTYRSGAELGSDTHLFGEMWFRCFCDFFRPCALPEVHSFRLPGRLNEGKSVGFPRAIIFQNTRHWRNHAPFALCSSFLSSWKAAISSCFWFLWSSGPFLGPDRIKSCSLLVCCGSTVHQCVPSGNWILNIGETRHSSESKTFLSSSQQSFSVCSQALSIACFSVASWHRRISLNWRRPLHPKCTPFFDVRRDDDI